MPRHHKATPGDAGPQRIRLVAMPETPVRALPSASPGVATKDRIAISHWRCGRTREVLPPASPGIAN
jgi:hypothetical protein